MRTGEWTIKEALELFQEGLENEVFDAIDARLPNFINNRESQMKVTAFMKLCKDLEIA